MAMNLMLERRARNASLTADLGLLKTTKLVPYFECGATPAMGMAGLATVVARPKVVIVSARRMIPVPARAR